MIDHLLVCLLAHAALVKLGVLHTLIALEPRAIDYTLVGSAMLLALRPTTNRLLDYLVVRGSHWFKEQTTTSRWQFRTSSSPRTVIEDASLADLIGNFVCCTMLQLFVGWVGFCTVTDLTITPAAFASFCCYTVVVTLMIAPVTATVTAQLIDRVIASVDGAS